ncbi:hypothetical protein [Rosistilla oblonga]|uniref:hypothetical protein n=1 Tax=Rosistilla oblonga TaxID=2527990 RepID=UPI003A96FDE3
MSTPDFSSRNWLVGIWIALAGCLVVALQVTGRLHPQQVPDSPSYLEFPFDSFAAALKSIRTPVYPAILELFELTGAMSLLPHFQMLVHLIACAMLALGFSKIGIPRWQTFLMAAASLLSITLWFNVNLISTDSLAVSMSLITCSLLLMYCNTRSPWLLLAISLMSIVTILCRPAYLFLVGFLPAAAALIWRDEGLSWTQTLRRCCVLFFASLAPVVIYSLIRLVVVGQFGVVAFGSQNLAGVTVQFMDQEIVQQLPADQQAFAQHVLDSRIDWYAEHPALSEGMGYQTMEDRWNAMIYEVVVPTARRDFGDDVLRQHAEISSLNREIILRKPIAYAIWIAKAVRQTVRIGLAHIGLHPPFFVCLLVGIVALILLPLCRRDADRCVSAILVPEEVTRANVLTLAFALLYCVLGMIPVVLTSAPLGRFVDAVTVLIPGAIAVLLSHHLASVLRNYRGS